MEAIRNYLESLFSSLPQDARVTKAKEDLLAMMEDKYRELIASGSRENEAVGIVISEFGNIDELKEELGIPQDAEETLTISGLLANSYIETTLKKSKIIAFSVFLFIAGAAFPILAEEAAARGILGMTRPLAEVLGISGLMICIALGVGILVAAHFSLERYEDIEKKPFRLESGLKSTLQDAYFEEKRKQLPRLIAGIAVLILSFLPAAVIELGLQGETRTNIGGAVFLLLVAFGVYLLVSYGLSISPYEKLMAQRDSAAVEKDRKLSQLSSAYWILLLAVFLGYSFMTGKWQYSWIIWPIGALVFAALAALVDIRKRTS